MRLISAGSDVDVPMPIASVIATTAVKPGARTIRRKPWRTSRAMLERKAWRAINCVESREDSESLLARLKTGEAFAPPPVCPDGGGTTD